MKPKVTFFSNNLSLNCRGKLISFNPPKIMAVINITPDSFYSGSRYTKSDELRIRAEKLLSEGASILDIGAYSSRPGAGIVSPKEEFQRLANALNLLRKYYPQAILSIDTFRSEIARKAVSEFQVDLINDISGGDLDTKMFSTISELGIPYILMHMKGNPANMQSLASYENPVREILKSLSEKIEKLNSMGVKDLVIDPGFGFAKSIDHNYEILNNLDVFQVTGLPIMVGVSRKSMIYNLLNSNAEEALNGSTVLHTIALMKGASILRVHDVAPAMEAVILVEKTLNHHA